MSEQDMVSMGDATDKTWFEVTARENFERAFLPSSNQPNLRYLQLGVFRGDASVWLLENVLTHPSSSLIDIDLWENDRSPELAEYDMDQVCREYLERTRKYLNSCFYRMSTLDYLTRAVHNHDRPFDFIYVDADHAVVPTLECAVLGYRLLKPGGVICFDDYVWQSKYGMMYEPHMAIDLFKIMYGDRMQVLRVDAQCWMKRVI